MNLWTRFFRPREPIIPYTADAAQDWLFDPSSRFLELTAPRKAQYAALTGSNRGLIRLTRLQRLGGHLPGLDPIHVDVRNASVEFIGLPERESSVEVESKANARDEAEACRLLKRVRFRVQNGRIQLSNPPHRANRSCQTALAVTCPTQRQVAVRGSYSSVRVARLSGGAHIETTHARITMLNVGGEVHARVREGIIDYSGSEGSVRLFAGWELNLRFPSPTFSGRIEAIADGPVRVLLVPGFVTCFEADLAKSAWFVCRADIKEQIRRREQGQRLIYTFGEGRPAIRMVSLKGPVVIDNVTGACEGVSTWAESPPDSHTCVRSWAEKSAELLRRLARYAKQNGLAYSSEHGRGSHLKVRIGGQRTIIPEHNKELGKGLLNQILKDLGTKERSLP